MFAQNPMTLQQRRDAIRNAILSGPTPTTLGGSFDLLGDAIQARGGLGLASPFPAPPQAPGAFPAPPMPPQGQQGQQPIGMSPMFQSGFDRAGAGQGQPGMTTRSAAPNRAGSGLFPQTGQQGGGFDLQGLLSNIFARGGGGLY